MKKKETVNNKYWNKEDVKMKHHNDKNKQGLLTTLNPKKKRETEKAKKINV